MGFKPLNNEQFQSLIKSAHPSKKELIKQELDNFVELLTKTFFYIVAAQAVATYDKHALYNKWMTFIVHLYEQEAMELPEGDIIPIQTQATNLNYLGLLVSVDEERILDNISKLASIVLRLKKSYGQTKFDVTYKNMIKKKW